MGFIHSHAIIRMPDKHIKGSLSGIVDKMNEAYNSLLGDGFSPGINRRIVPEMVDGTVAGWKMQCYENDTWVDLNETPFESMEKLIAYYKEENQ